MNTLENIILENDNLMIGYLNSSSTFKTVARIVTDLSTDDKDKIQNFITMIESKLNPGEVLLKTISQVTYDQHLSEERILYYIDENVNILFISTLNQNDLLIYNTYKNVCQNLIEENEL